MVSLYRQTTTITLKIIYKSNFIPPVSFSRMVTLLSYISLYCNLVWYLFCVRNHFLTFCFGNKESKFLCFICNIVSILHLLTFFSYSLFWTNWFIPPFIFQINFSKSNIVRRCLVPPILIFYNIFCKDGPLCRILYYLRVFLVLGIFFSILWFNFE